MIPYNKPFLAGSELACIEQAIRAGHLSGDGQFTQRCHRFFADTFGFGHPLLTTSCTAALEMAALLLDLGPGDEVIVPSYTFVSTANAFVLRGARVVFADSNPLNPNLDTEALEALVTSRTRAVVPIHYAGIACDLDPLLATARRHNLTVVEDAAPAFDSYYRGRALGSFGQLAAFSFHETKNIQAGEGGMLVINDEQYARRAEIIREKGTNRTAFFRGEVARYSWVDVGSSYLPSELTAAYLWGQLEHWQQIQQVRRRLWHTYNDALAALTALGVGLPVVPEYATVNGHLFYLVCRDEAERTALIARLRERGIMAVFHYLPLHASPYYALQHDGRALPWAEYYGARLVRLPLFCELTAAQQRYIIDEVLTFYQSR
ncbi:dTDP-4-amino-4,6-dideoxygalactose transaminase [Hymenobacter sp. 15J16-1T3B]|uniref:dTDP-4-amino-4,6-dideoxygalactose transaminase n=1 Tax=Hymenobacter sp. 15J16-1T3B TaxID=2886941 RepID=UPI001D1300C0|nr:dTDP-4-amino-4,6-dideoxygalactose transaminase [Hymenobacter sp. 15J16-1T3B]MCC3158788.1 dTDP-4-amino-4,6-dideoxygalactose transaminase [Hymenobacter sp. 15J16-1T3B]